MDLCATPAVGLARLIRAGELSATELLAAVLARIHEVNPAVNAIVTLAAEQAAAVAVGLDEQAARSSFAGPLHGLPIAVKDLAETAGIRTTFGSPVFASFVPSFDAPHVALLKQAGAVVIGKTNTPEFGAGSQTFNPVFGPTRNPYDTRLTPGGSSGGAAAAVAARMIPFADGSDLAASVRNPAAFCGLVGLRTTPGLVPADVLDPLGVIGPIARTAPDAALLLAGMCGTDPGLPLARPDRPADFLDLRPAALRGLRVAWTSDLGDLPVQPDVRAVLGSCRGLLEEAGCAVTDAAPALSDADEVFQVLRAARMAGMAPLLRAHREQVKATLAWNIEKGIALGGEQVAAARAGQAEIFQRVRSFLADGPYDVLALPTAQVVPFPVEQEWVTEINGEPMATYIDWMRSCSRITVSAHPAVTVPAGLTPSGPDTAALPVGLQLVGRYGADRRLLEIAAAVMELAGPALPGSALPGQAGEGLGAAAPERGPLRRALGGQCAEVPQALVADRDQAEVGPGHPVLEVGRERPRGGRVVHPEGKPVEGLRGGRRRAQPGDHRGQRVAGLVVPGPVPRRRAQAAPGQVGARHPVAEDGRVLGREGCLQRGHCCDRRHHRAPGPAGLPAIEASAIEGTALSAQCRRVRGVGGGDAREQLGQGGLHGGQPLHQAGRGRALRLAQPGGADPGRPRASRARGRAPCPARRGRRRRPRRLDEPGLEPREMLLVLGEQRPEHPRPGRGRRIAADGGLVYPDQVLFRGDNRLQCQHIVAERRMARQRIGADEGVRRPAACGGEQHGQHRRRGQEHAAPRHDVGHTGTLPRWPPARRPSGRW
jgi:amidase